MKIKASAGSACVATMMALTIAELTCGVDDIVELLLRGESGYGRNAALLESNSSDRGIKLQLRGDSGYGRNAARRLSQDRCSGAMELKASLHPPTKTPFFTESQNAIPARRYTVSNSNCYKETNSVSHRESAMSQTPVPAKSQTPLATRNLQGVKLQYLQGDKLR